jgi:hypothetical protein
LSDLGAKGKSKNVHHPKSRKIFAILCKNEQAHFSCGDNRGKIDGYKFKVFADDNDYCSGLIVAAGLTAVLH